MSDITVTVSGGDGSSSITAGVGDTINVTTSPLAGPLPELQIVAGSGITVDSKNGVSTISANLPELSIPANLADLNDVSAGATSGQVLSYNGTEWGGLTLAIPANLADLSNVNGAPTTGQVLAWDGSSWAPADDQTGGSSNVANLADLTDVSSTAPATGQALVWSGSEWAGGNIPPGTTVNGLSGSVNLVSGDNVAITVDGQNLTIASVGGGDGVTAVNGLTGSLTLAAGDGVTIANSGSTITLNATADLTGYATETYVDSAVANLVNGSPAALDTLAELANALNNDSDFAANVTTLISQKADANHEHVKANITDLTTGDLDMQGNRVLFANYYATQGDFPDPAVYHGMVAHSHADGAAFYAHAGVWVKLADADHGHEIANVAGLQTALDGKQPSGNYAEQNHSHQLAELTDVSGSPSASQALIYNGTEWQPGDIPAGTTINSLSGSVVLANGTGITLTESGQTLTLTATGSASGGDVDGGTFGAAGNVLTEGGDNLAAETGDTLTVEGGSSAAGDSIQLLRSSVAGATPGSLLAGELAINIEDGLLYWQRANGTIASADIDLTLATVATSGSYSDLSGIPTEFAPAAHTHTAAEITDFGTAAASAAPLQSLNTLTGTLTIAGSGGTTVTEAGSTITVASTAPPTVLADLSDVSTATPSTGQVLKWTGSAWAPQTDATNGTGGGGGGGGYGSLLLFG